MNFFVHYFHVSPNIQKYNGSFEQYFDISLNIQNKAYVSIRRFFLYVDVVRRKIGPNYNYVLFI